MTRSLQASVGFHSKSALITHYRNKLMSSISDVTDGLPVKFPHCAAVEVVEEMVPTFIPNPNWLYN